jgi:hypothetical protein
LLDSPEDDRKDRRPIRVARCRNPSTLRKATLEAKYAQHVVLIRFPIALFIAGVAFDFLAQWRKRRLLTAAAY